MFKLPKWAGGAQTSTEIWKVVVKEKYEVSLAWWIKTIFNLFLSLGLKAQKLACDPYGLLTLTVISQSSRRGHSSWSV